VKTISTKFDDIVYNNKDKNRLEKVCKWHQLQS